MRLLDSTSTLFPYTTLFRSCLPIAGGVVLSTERMKRIKEVDAGDLIAVVEPGVITGELQTVVETQGLLYPPDPASDRKSTRLNSSHVPISYAVFCLTK